MADKDKWIIHIDPSEQNPSIPEYGPDECPDCKIPAKSGFGLAGGGYGVYTFCPNCARILSKQQIEDF